jgi:hypothetical protein
MYSRFFSVQKAKQVKKMKTLESQAQAIKEQKLATKIAMGSANRLRVCFEKKHIHSDSGEVETSYRMVFIERKKCMVSKHFNTPWMSIDKLMQISNLLKFYLAEEKGDRP